MDKVSLLTALSQLREYRENARGELAKGLDEEIQKIESQLQTIEAKEAAPERPGGFVFLIYHSSIL